MYILRLEPTEALQVVFWADKEKGELEAAGKTDTELYKIVCSIGRKYEEAIEAGQQ